VIYAIHRILPPGVDPTGCPEAPGKRVQRGAGHSCGHHLEIRVSLAGCCPPRRCTWTLSRQLARPTMLANVLDTARHRYASHVGFRQSKWPPAVAFRRPNRRATCPLDLRRNLPITHLRQPVSRTWPCPLTRRPRFQPAPWQLGGRAGSGWLSDVEPLLLSAATCALWTNVPEAFTVKCTPYPCVVWQAFMWEQLSPCVLDVESCPALLHFPLS
jgi:hypothetical protein